MAAGFVSHNITTASGVTFAVRSWVPDTAAPDVGCVPIALITDGTNGVSITQNAPTTNDYGMVVAIHPDSVNANGQTTMSASAPVVLPSDFVGTSGFMKKEDVASADGDAGIPAMAIRKATPANTSGTDGDYEMLQMSAGRLWVSDSPSLTNFGAGEYETVAASQTAQVLGATGATGDYISGVLVVPATTSPGNVLLLDNATSITVFTGGATSVSNLVPFFIPLGMISVSGAWKITTGANVSCIGIGNFT
jgi:hypothetical protein